MPGSRQVIVLTVDHRSGRGDHVRIQDAIDAAPAEDSAAGSVVVIRIKPGEYREKLVVAKPCITLVGTNASTTVVTWNESPTVSVLASDFIAKRLTFQNTFGSSSRPAAVVAARVAGDRAAFYGCRFVSSSQGTLLDDTGRHYYRGCYVEGATDIVFGNGKALFDKCHLHSTSLAGGGAFTAQKRASESEDTGFSFVGCKLTGLGAGTAILGRPGAPYSRVVFALSYMSCAVRPEGWDDDDRSDPAKRRTVFYGQYQCYGEGSKTKTDGRAAWSRDLSQAEAAPFITKVWVAGQEWLR